MQEKLFNTNLHVGSFEILYKIRILDEFFKGFWMGFDSN